jgi:hypothetical protein
MRDSSDILNLLEREIRTMPADEVERLDTLLRERGRLVKIMAASAPVSRENYERLREHRAAGQELLERLRRERELLVEAWGDSTRERQVLRMFDATTEPRPARFAELG